MVYIIDGNHLACRCFFAVDPLQTSYGKPVNMIFGYINFLKAFIKRFGSEHHYFIAWDAGGKSWRHELYPEYKIGRQKFSDDFYEQLREVKQVVRALGIEQYSIENVEADDIIGTLTYKSRKNGKRVLIVSSDHDFEQLISNGVEVLSPSLAQSKEILKDYNYVVSKYNLKPKQLIEYMSLTGDSSDHISGVPGVGEKTALRLLKANANLQNIIDNIDNLKFLKNENVVDAAESLKDKIRQHVETILLTKKLVTINCLLPAIEPNFEKRVFHLGKLIRHFKRLEFNRFLEKIKNWEDVFDEASLR